MKALLTFFTVLIALSAHAAPRKAWSHSFPAIAKDVRAGEPLVIHIVVPLCSNQQISCGSASLGNPKSLRGNLYWGAMYGNKRFFDKAARYKKVSTRKDVSGVLERVVYRRHVSAKKWGTKKKVEQIVVLDAVHGNYINSAVETFWRSATHGAQLNITDGGKIRKLRVHVMGYAGHNRLMDGIKLSKVSAKKRAPTPAFVLACFSKKYFSGSLRAAGSKPLVMTSSFIAPEGYATVAMADALGDNVPEPRLRDAVVRAYAKYQRITVGQAGRYFPR